MSGCVGRGESGGHGRQGTWGPRKGDEEQSERVGGWLGVRNVTRTTYGSCV